MTREQILARLAWLREIERQLEQIKQIKKPSTTETRH